MKITTREKILAQEYLDELIQMYSFQKDVHLRESDMSVEYDETKKLMNAAEGCREIEQRLRFIKLVVESTMGRKKRG